MRTLLASVIAAAAVTVCALAITAAPDSAATTAAPTSTPEYSYMDTMYHGYPTLDTNDWGTDIPRCASDDWNSTHLPRCYVESPSSIILIDQDDETLAYLAR